MTQNIDLIASLRASEPLLKQQGLSIVWAIVNEDGTKTASGASFQNNIQRDKLANLAVHEIRKQTPEWQAEPFILILP